MLVMKKPCKGPWPSAGGSTNQGLVHLCPDEPCVGGQAEPEEEEGEEEEEEEEGRARPTTTKKLAAKQDEKSDG
jgi:hypothetical protein